MKSLPKQNPSLLQPAVSGIVAKNPSSASPACALKQRGVVLFVTLIALLAMSLAAVALIRSVDTGAMIAGNLTFKRTATIAGTAEIESAIAVLTNLEAGSGGADVKTDPAHPLNNNNPANGYYSFIDPSIDLTNSLLFNWTAQASPQVEDDYGNKKRFVIQRVCLSDSTPTGINECLFVSSQALNNNSQAVVGYDEVCVPGTPGGCDNSSSNTVQYRITVRTEGPKNTVSYVQAFVY